MIYLPHRRFAFRSPTSPPDQSNLKVWLKGDAGITLNGSDVSAWADQSGNGNDAAQADTAKQPAYVSNALNGIPGVQSDGVDELLMSGEFTLNQPFTIYTILNVTAWTSADRIIADAADTNGVLQFGTTPDILLYAKETSLSDSGLTLSNWHVLTTIFNSTSSVIQINKSTASTGNAGATNWGGYTVGGKHNGPASVAGTFVELLIYSGAHDATTRGLAQDYLAWRGGLSI